MASGSAGSIYVDLLLRDSKYVAGLRRAQGQTSAVTGAISSSMRSLAASVAGAFSIREIINYADTWRQVQGRLSLVTKDATDLANVNERLFKVAQDTRQPLADTVNFYSRLAQYVPEVERAQYDLIGVTESVASALAITGETSASAQAAMIQFTQAIGTNFEAAGQEIRSLQEQAPRLAQALANAIGDGTKSLKQLQDQGLLTRQSVLGALAGNSAAAEKLREELAKIPVTVGQAFTNLNSAMLTFIGNNQLAMQSTEQFANLISALAKNLDGVAGAVAVIGSVVIAKYVIAFAAASTATLATAVSIAGLNGAMALLVGTSPAVIAGLRGTTVATLGLNAALAPIGGILGVTAGALAATVFYVGGLSNAMEGLEATISVVSGKVLKLANYLSLLKGESLKEIRDFNAALDKAVEDDLERLANKRASISIDIPKTPVIEMPKIKGSGGKEIDGIFKKYEKEIRGVTAETIKFEEAQADLAKLMNAGKISLDDYNSALDRVQDGFGKSSKAAFDFSFDAAEAAREASRSIQSSLADFLFDPFDKGVKGMLQSFGNMLRRMAAEAAAANILGGLQSSGIGSGIGSFFSSIFSSFAGGFASGGVIPAGQWGIVGEQGPELAFGGNTGQTIIPQVGAANVSVNIINNAGANVSQRPGTNGASLDVIIDQAVAQGINTPGSRISSALAGYNSRGLTRR